MLPMPFSIGVCPAVRAFSGACDPSKSVVPHQLITIPLHVADQLVSGQCILVIMPYNPRGCLFALSDVVALHLQEACSLPDMTVIR